MVLSPGHFWATPAPEPATVGLLRAHLKGVEEKSDEHFDEAQHAARLLVRGEDEDQLVDPEERDEGQCGLSQSANHKTSRQSHSQSGSTETRGQAV